MTKSNYSIAVDASGKPWACQPDSPGDLRVRQEADEIMGEANLEPDYTVHRGVTLTDDASGEVVFTATEDNALIDDERCVFKFAVRA